MDKRRIESWDQNDWYDAFILFGHVICLLSLHHLITLLMLLGDDILSEENMNKVARNLPETIEQLSALGVMGSSDLCRYGDALLHEISDFIEKYILVR